MTNRIKRLLEVLSPYSFNLYYIKGKDMILSDFLSRQDPGNDENTKEIIPISFNMKLVLQDKYYNIANNNEVNVYGANKIRNESQWSTIARGAWFKEEIRSP